MKLIESMLCRRRYKVQTKVKRWFWRIFKKDKDLAKEPVYKKAGS